MRRENADPNLPPSVWLPHNHPRLIRKRVFEIGALVDVKGPLRIKIENSGRATGKSALPPTPDMALHHAN